jgi:FAD/FMN-containing dehydrogenase/Fe-S oxidoreductase
MMSLPVVQTKSEATVNPADLEKALKNSISGEVRFDRLSRALYSTDASIYQIIPLGVVIPKSEEDIIAILKICGQFRVPMTVRGAGTSQAGQAIGPGLQVDCSKYFNRVLEINPNGRWARVQPGCVLDDLNAEAKGFGLHFPHDISTSNRATLGGMIANNSSGARSVIYGKTIDHVLELKVVLSDGSVVHLRSLTEDELEAKSQQQDLEGDCYRVVRRLAADHADEIARRYPRILRRVGGYNLDEFVDAAFRAEGISSLSQDAVTSNMPTQRADAPYSGRQHADFNLSRLLVGSEGTLGIVLEANLQLVELPKAKALLVVQFANLLEALAATPTILTHHPSAVEVIDKYILDSTRLNSEASRLRDFLSGDPDAILIIEFQGERGDEMPARLEQLQSHLQSQNIGSHYHRALENSAQSRIWKLRKAALGLSMAEKGDAKALSFVEDSAVAPEHLRNYIAEFLDVIARHGTRAGVYAHASVGCLHVRPVIDLKTEEGVRQFSSISEEVSDLVLKYGGAISGEHGDGLVRSPFQEKMYGPQLYQGFREIKRTFDPHNLFNPGKIVDAPPLTANLRYGPAYVTPKIPTTFDFSVDGGIARAAELCAGVGECRKKREGTMCPSYQATREEQHSTRGRANALRLAMTGQLGLDGFTDPAVKEVLDLCLECKACKSECPTNVDMARLKAEFLLQYYKKHGLPWRNRILGRLNALSRFGQSGVEISNWFLRSRPGRWFLDKFLGIDRRRTLPPFSEDSSAEWFEECRAQLKSRNPAHSLIVDMFPALLQIISLDQWSELGYPDRVLLFADTFSRYYEPSVWEAARDVVSQLGFTVFPSPRGLSARNHFRSFCCGRPAISNGLLELAVRQARLQVNQLFPWAEAGMLIVGCEPSCILTMKDDYPALLRGEEREEAEVVAAACLTFEEFVESSVAKRPFHVKFRPGPKTILVQSHCHQRALVGMEPALRLLRRIPGAEVIDPDAGCCGMAGSFGYEKEHYEISRLIGEQRLFPAVRQADADTVIVASGFSCRTQIHHFTGKTAMHPAQLLASLMERPQEPGETTVPQNHLPLAYA